jgi:hypothetical protein
MSRRNLGSRLKSTQSCFLIPQPRKKSANLEMPHRSHPIKHLHELTATEGSKLGISRDLWIANVIG